MINHLSNLKIDVLVNSHGPHEQVRIREPFCGLQRLGVDCKLNRYPFLLQKTIRQNSLVIWQRPRPTSWEEQLYIIRFIRSRDSILLVEWDDHPKLFPKEIRKALSEISMAPLKICHALHTSSELLAASLKVIQPNSFIFPNAIWRIPELNLEKHLERGKKIRIFVGNQNRISEHKQISSQLKEWCEEDPQIQVIVIGDLALASSLPKESIEQHPLLPYLNYRAVMRSCHIALLPLEDTLANNCKTEIKWMEASAESLASVGGPGLYREAFNDNKNGLFCSTLDELIPKAKFLKENILNRIKLVKAAHKSVTKNLNLRNQLPARIRLYEEIWDSREKLDQTLVNRFPEILSNRETKL